MLQIRPSIPIILCTGYSNLINEEQAKAIVIKGFIIKPMSKKALLNNSEPYLMHDRWLNFAPSWADYHK